MLQLMRYINTVPFKIKCVMKSQRVVIKIGSMHYKGKGNPLLKQEHMCDDMHARIYTTKCFKVTHLP